jgi:Methyltransferase domain
VSSGGSVRSLSDLFSRRGFRRTDDGGAPTAVTTPVDPGPIFSTKALRRFLSCLVGRENPVLLDLGPVVGSNVTFFGEQLGCKIFVEDIFADVERHVRGGREDALAGFLDSRFGQADESVDGILCWDLLDYVTRPAAQTLAREMTRLLKSDGALLAFFGTAPQQDTHYTKYIIIDDLNLRHRGYPASKPRTHVLLNRDIIRMFDGLRVSDSFLLQTNVREILFRKPAYLGAQKG